ncbi:hypothetical protein N7456_011177 [Penicillium angulare]|uniref:Beta-lactamase-related domain-containing protein n=1 Tax=Penicillium angulare TaxID=116970 RepID=A0A9W9ETB2_9EURO|nr:hypothetical protein N7456_011177 [Penicillium angulare]
MRNLILSYASVLFTTASAVNYCPFYGPEYPPVTTQLHENEIFKAAVNTFTTTLDTALATDQSINTTSFAIQLFSTEDSASDPLFAYYYTSPATRNASVGVTSITGDTVFRVASVSKIWTVYLWLIKAGGDKLFNEPIIKYVPELRDMVHQQRRNKTQQANNVDFAKWADVTIGELAGQMAGISRDYGFTDIAHSLPPATLQALGFPLLDKAQTPICGASTPCNRTGLFHGLPNSHPIFPTSHSPAYSNAAFQILAYALEKITHKPFEDLLSEAIIEPLGLTKSSYSAPESKYGVIPGTEASSFWSFDVGEETPAGGIYSSPNDLSTVGRSILSNTLLSPALTRRWLKPISHTSSLDFAAGRPWEIFSFKRASSRTIDLFTKTGDLVSYAALLALSPDHNIGFSVLSAGENSTIVTNSVPSLSNLITKIFIPALEEAAKQEAKKYTGTYATGSSSLTLAIDENPGLAVKSWTNNGVNMLQTVKTLYQAANVDDISVRLYYSELEYSAKSGSRFVGFRAVIQNLAGRDVSAPFDGIFSQACVSWEVINAVPYGNVGLDEFLFEVNRDGDVVSIQPRALRVTLKRNSTISPDL